MAMQISQIKEFLDIIPSLSDNGKTIKWNNTTGLFEFFLANYITSIDRESTESNRIKFTLIDGSYIYLTLGALAWLDSLEGVNQNVDSVFGRTGAVTAQNGDYTAAQVTNAFNKAADTLDNVSAGTTNKHLTATLLAELNANTSARHSHTNKSILDLITDVGSGKIVTDDERTLWNSYTSTNSAFIISTIVSLLQNGTGLEWTYDSEERTLTPTITLQDFTTDNLAEGTTNKYYTSENRGLFEIHLNSGGVNGDVSVRLSGLVEGTDYPTGWTLSVGVNATDLIVTHGLGRELASIHVWAKDTVTSEDQEMKGDLGYVALYRAFDKNSFRIDSLAGNPKELYIYPIFY